MTQTIISLSKIAVQTCQVTLNQQDTRLFIDTKTIQENGDEKATFIDVFLDSQPIILGMLCRDRVPIIQLKYLGFQGDLMFYDKQGTSDPLFYGFSDRFILVYDDEAKLS